MENDILCKLRPARARPGECGRAHLGGPGAACVRAGGLAPGGGDEGIRRDWC